MRRFVVALVVVSLALSLAGCGGGEEEAAAPETPAAGTPAPAAAPVAAEAPDRSAPESAAVFEPFPLGDAVPDVLSKKIEEGQPTLILFVDGSQQVTNEVRSAVDKALRSYGGVVELVLFDLGKYASVDASGQVVVDEEGIKADKTAAQAVTLARTLSVSGLPYILMTDDQGYVVFRHRGLVDSPFLQMHMERLSE